MHIALDVMADFQQSRIGQQRLQKSGNGRGRQTFRPFAFSRGKKVEGFRLFRFGGKRQINRIARQCLPMLALMLSITSEVR